MRSSEVVLYRAHNPEAGGSNPPPATRKIKGLRRFRDPFFVSEIVFCPIFVLGRNRPFESLRSPDRTTLNIILRNAPFDRLSCSPMPLSGKTQDLFREPPGRSDAAGRLLQVGFIILLHEAMRQLVRDETHKTRLRTSPLSKMTTTSCRTLNGLLDVAWILDCSPDDGINRPRTEREAESRQEWGLVVSGG